MISVISDYTQRLWRPGFAPRKSENLPPSLLTLLFSSRLNRVSVFGFLPGLAPNEFFGDAFCPYRLPAEAP